MLRYITNILQILISPSSGWDDIARRQNIPDAIATRDYYPLLGLMAASAFMKLAYISTPFNIILPELIHDAVISFVAFFISRFVSNAIWTSDVTSRLAGVKKDNERREVFILYTLGLLSLIRLITNMLPVTLSIMEFLPLLAMVEMWMGYRFIGVAKEKLVGFLIYSSATIFLPPFIIYHLFFLLLPS